MERRIIGRQAELEQLQHALATVRQRRTPLLLTLVGEAGVGKTRLLQEFGAWLAASQSPIQLFTARADGQTGQRTYALIRDLFSSFFDIQESDPPLVARKKWEQNIIGVMGMAGALKSHFLGYLLGFNFSDSLHLRGILNDGRQIRDRAFYYASQFFQMVANPLAASRKAAPVVVLFLDNLQWADDGSLDMIEYLVRETRNVPLLVVALARPSLITRHPEWGAALGDKHLHVVLPPLSEDESQQLVKVLLHQVPELPPMLRDFLTQRAEGNPFYLEELVKILIEAQVIMPIAGAALWQVAPDRIAQVRIPPTLAGVIQARLESLPPSERDILMRAAVMGRTFWAEAVAFLLAADHAADAPLAPQTIEAALTNLAQAELIVPRPSPAFAGTHEYTFRQALFQDVIYWLLPESDRQRHHAQAAAWLIAQGGERVREYAGLIGQHFEQAALHEQAARWYTEAGRHAFETHVPSAAQDYYQKALAYLPDNAPHSAARVSLYEGLAEVLFLQAHYIEAIAIYRSMREAAAHIGDVLAQARAWNGTARAQNEQGDYYTALESSVAAEHLAQGDDPTAQQVRAEALVYRAISWFRLGNIQAALDFGERSLALSTSANSLKIMARSTSVLGWVHTLLGHNTEADARMSQALAIYRDLDDRLGVDSMLNNMGVTAANRGDYQAAYTFCMEALTMAQEIGARTLELVILNNICGILVGLGDYPAAEVQIRHFLTIPETEDWFAISESYAYLAEACLGQGNIPDAVLAARRALTLAREQGEPKQLGLAWRVMGMVTGEIERRNINLPEALNTPPLPPTETSFAESVRILTGPGVAGEQARTLRVWAHYNLQRGDREQAQARWTAARDLFQQFGMHAEVARMDRTPLFDF